MRKLACLAAVASLLLSTADNFQTLSDGLTRFQSLSRGPNACKVTAFGAVGDNQTDDTTAIQHAIDSCHESHPHGAVVVFDSSKTFRVRASIAMTSDTTLLLGRNTALFNAFGPGDPIVQEPRCSTLYWKHGPTAVLCGTNLSNIAILGTDESSSVLDGGGWPWYLAGIANKSMQGSGPRMFEPTWSTNITLSRIGFLNSPAWTVHPTYCKGVLAEHISILAPRFTPNTDGFDPDSTSDVVLRDSIIDTGDDGISIKSQNATVNGKHVQVPSDNIHIYRVKVLSRNFCVGSATFGGVSNLLMEDCEIGDDSGSSPWAIKYKSHQSYAGAMVNHTFRRLRVGNIRHNSYQQRNGGYFMQIALRYHPLIPNRTCSSWNCPAFQNISFEDIVITGAESAGGIYGFKGDLLQGLRFRNVTFVNKPKRGWDCGYVNLTNFEATGVDPPLKCSEGARSEVDDEFLV